MIPKLIRNLISKLPRGKGRISRSIAKRSPKTLQCVEMIGPLSGLKMYLDLSDEFQAQMSIGCYQFELIKELQALVRPGDVVLTAGTHVGYMALALAKCGAKVIGFECDPNLVDQCQRNLDLNGLDSTLIPVGLGSSDGELEMNISIHKSQSSFAIAHYSYGNKIKVKVRRGDDVLKELEINRLDGLLIDVEGWECHLLKGLAKTLKQSPPRWAIVECFDVALENAGTSQAELRALLNSFGLKTTLKGSDFICSQ